MRASLSWQSTSTSQFQNSWLCSVVISAKHCVLTEISLRFSSSYYCLLWTVFMNLPVLPSISIIMWTPYSAGGWILKKQAPRRKAKPRLVGSRQPQQLETLMAALNIHCCRWVCIWINSLINECKLRTKQPKEQKHMQRATHCTSGSSSVGSIHLHRTSKSLSFSLVLIQSEQKFLVPLPLCDVWQKQRTWHFPRIINIIT